MMTETTWQTHAAALAATIAQEVNLSEAWRAAFEQTPRHRFVPDVAEDQAYEDASIVIKTIHIGGFDWPVSSSTRPSLMAYMLEALQLQEGMTVLEIGTGTGYNAALLCNRLGDDALVASVDLDAELVDAARARLDALGLHPTLTALDGRNTTTLGQTFDRIIATAGARRIPPAWGSQLNEDGRLVADVGGGTCPRIATLTRQPNGDLRGRLHTRPGWFMPMRPNAAHPHEHPGISPTPIDQDHAIETTTLTALQDLAENEGLAFAINWYMQPEMITDLPADSGHGPGSLITFTDGSWVETTKTSTRYSGPNPHLNDLAQLATAWRELGKPGSDDLRLTVTPDGAHTLSAYGYECLWQND
ncbi:methyltransferase domain-containing protein [Glycomyces sp. NPDC047010]|uniref:methyltransferase domain-containing protein n=1 Tax=Glycomyces sp. NPDC047010 TaxID=3155023 RepID=UPI0033E3F107